MSLLLDSNVLLWWFAGDRRLPATLVETLRNEADLLVSVVTPWELWIKARTGKLTLPPDLDSGFDGDAFTIISPTVEEARRAAALPPIHRDPFDRMIIAQALRRQATVVTADSVFADYGCDVILV